MINPMDMRGKAIIVTGASSGIGHATAILLSKLGAKAVLIARNEERLKQTYEQLEGSGHSIYSYDLSDINGIPSLVKTIASECSEVSGLAYCAGIGNRCPLKLLDSDSIIDMMKVNTLAFVELCKVLSKANYRAESASYVCVSSAAAIKGEKGLLSYSMTKGALNSAIHVMAKELGTFGIRVNAVLPSWVNTEMAEDIFENFGKGEFDAAIDTKQYLGMGRPDDIANTIAFLLSDASRFITGTELIADGGYTS